MSVMTFFDATPVQALIANYGYVAVFVVVTLDSSGLRCPARQFSPAPQSTLVLGKG
jgi:hypothetical protein